MRFDWFSVKATNVPNNLLIAFEGSESGKSAWEALDYIPIILLITILVTLAVAILRLMDSVFRAPIPVNTVVASLGLVSVLLILFRVVDPPNFGTDGIIMFVGTVQFSMFLALLAAAGIAFGGSLAMREEGFSLRSTRVGAERIEREE